MAKRTGEMRKSVIASSVGFAALTRRADRRPALAGAGGGRDIDDDIPF
jgi:hypothetical protein